MNSSKGIGRNGHQGRVRDYRFPLGVAARKHPGRDFEDRSGNAYANLRIVFSTL